MTWRHAFTALCCVVGLGWTASVYAQDKTDPIRATSVELSLDGEDVVISKPDGWVVAKAPKGSIALMRLAGDKSSQLDVRYTPGVDNTQRDGHFSTFHTNLKSMGLKKVSSQKVSLESEAFKGDVYETIYELTAKKKPYRLVVWHIHRNSAVWFFTLFEQTGESNSTEPLKLLVTRIKIS